MFYDMLYELEKYLIVFVSLCFAFTELRLFFKYRKDYGKIILAVIGFYWAFYYIFSIIRPIFGIDVYLHQVFVRPGILFTVSVLLGRSWSKFKRLKEYGGE